ncbi:MAG TPA: hypothetical protein VF456_08890 [Vicinamibacterales bacterium]
MRKVRGGVGAICACAMFLSVTLAPSTCFGAELPDSTRISVRLVGGIDSESAKVGQLVQFLVMNDVIVDDAVLIRRDTVVVGEIVRARRVHWGFTHRKPRLAFRFRYTTAVNGQAITLRSTPARLQDVDDDQIVVQQGRDGHALLWTGGAILFDAYVDGNYEV